MGIIFRNSALPHYGIIAGVLATITLMLYASHSNSRGHKWFVDLTGSERSIQRPRLSEVTIATPMKENRTKILLLAYFRSGSSITADIVQQHPDVFYLFEPIHFLFENGYGLEYYRMDAVCDMINGKCRTPTEKKDTFAHLLKTMSSLFTCDFNKLPITIKRLASISTKSHAINSTLDECSKKQIHSPASILQKFESKCRDSIIAIKVIRFTAETVALLLHKFPNLKVIHLIRDPRGMISSRRWQRLGTKDIKIEATEVCQRYIRDIEILKALDEIYPGRIKPILYEAMAENPIEAGKNMYKFLGLNFTSAIETSIIKQTSSEKNGRYYNIQRKNSTEVAYGWKHKLNYVEVQSIDSVCGILYKIVGFNAVNNISDMNNTHFKTRQNMLDFGTYLHSRDGNY